MTTLKKFSIILLASSQALPLCWAASRQQPDPAEQPPNIVVILADDMGYSDLGSWGSEIETPHLDTLAANGLRYTQFRNTGRCCPSRAALMTGRHQHSVDMGWMTAVDEHRPGYRGQLSDDCLTLAEALKSNGYSTYMTGKWHLTVDGNFNGREAEAKPNGSWPIDRGFDKFYGRLTGGKSYQKTNGLYDGSSNVSMDSLPDDWYFTNAISQASVNYVAEHDFSQNPLFLYVAHYAPHRPLNAPQSRIDRCIERYKPGYDVLRQRRFANMQRLGILPEDQTLPRHESEYHKGYPQWTELNQEQQEQWVLEMATYAAMIEIMDDGIGRIVQELKNKGQFDNTLIFFLSDNGATKEGGYISQLAAELSNTPFRSYKQFTFNGGISSPLIVHWPERIAQVAGQIRPNPAHITDILPTCLEAARMEFPASTGKKEIPRPDGESLVSTFTGQSIAARNFYFEHQTSRAIVSGTWKLVSRSIADPWELYNLSEDPFEQTDLSDQETIKSTQLENLWQAWAERMNVLPLENLQWTKRIRHYKALYPDQDGID